MHGPTFLMRCLSCTSRVTSPLLCAFSLFTSTAMPAISMPANTRTCTGQKEEGCNGIKAFGGE